MDKKDLIKALQMDVEIPKVVQDKAAEAFDKIRAVSREGRINEAADSCGSPRDETENGGKNMRDDIRNAKKGKKTAKGKKRKKAGKSGQSVKRAAGIFLAAAVACAGVTATAAYFRWSRSVEEGMQVTEEQKVQLEEEHTVAFAMQECTKQGVTITAGQSITDNYFAHIVFRVDGYTLADGAEPAFENIRIDVDGETDFSWYGGFYDGLIAGPDGRAVYADGSPIDYENDKSLGRYVMGDGSMEYMVTLACSTKGYFIDKQIHVELENLGTVAKAEYLGTDVKDVWSFDWNLQGKASMEVYTPQAPLGDSGAVVTKAELSPVSIHVEYNFPMRTEAEEGIDENGNPIEEQMTAEPPMLQGVKMKDGTLYPYLMGGGGSMGYDEGDLNTYMLTLAMDRIIDVDQVESLLFARPGWKGGDIPTEEDFYVVPIG